MPGTYMSELGYTYDLHTLKFKQSSLLDSKNRSFYILAGILFFLNLGMGIIDVHFKIIC